MPVAPRPARRFTLRFATLAFVALAANALSVFGQAAGTAYFTISPCRVYDSRTPVHDPHHGGPDNRRDVQVSEICGVPAEATAVAVNVTTVNASQSGSLAVYNADLETAPAPYSTLAFATSRNRANSAFVALSTAGQVAMELAAGFEEADAVDLIIDVQGYFLENLPPTAVDDAATVLKDTTNNPIDVLANDTDPDGGTKLVIAVDTTSTTGSVTLTGGGTGVAYTPASGYCNTPPGTARDTFAYTITGGSTAQVSVSVVCAKIRIVTLTNGQDVSSPPGPTLMQGSPVSWTYMVSNLGSIALTNVKVLDDQGVTVACPKTALQPGESMNCSGNGLVLTCQYGNIGTVTAKTSTGETVSASDASYYFGIPCPE